MTFTTTLSTLRNSVYTKLNETSSGDVYTADNIDSRLNIQQRFLFRSKVLPFAQKSTVYTSYANTTVQTQPSIGDITLRVNASSGLPSSGSIWIDGDIITYTGLTPGASYDELTGIPASGDGSIEFAHETTSSVIPLYVLGSDFGYRAVVHINGERMFHKPLEEFLQGGSNIFTDVFEGSTHYLMFISLAADENIYLNYQKIPATMTSTVNCSIPDEFAENVLTYRTCVAMLQEYGDPDGLMPNMQQLAEFWESEMQNAINNQFGVRQQINFNAA